MGRSVNKVQICGKQCSYANNCCCSRCEIPTCYHYLNYSVKITFDTYIMNYPSLLCLYCIAMTKSDTTIIWVNLSYKLLSFGATVDPTLLQLAICTYLDLYTLHLFSAFSIVAHLLHNI